MLAIECNAITQAINTGKRQPFRLSRWSALPSGRPARPHRGAAPVDNP
jgi:hypothetical protein